MREGFVVSGFVCDGDGLTCEAVAGPASVFFEGHFPDDPVLPGVAQLSALVEPAALRAWPELGALRAASQVKFLRVVRPGEALSLRCTREGLRVRFTLCTGDEPVSEGTLDFRGPLP